MAEQVPGSRVRESDHRIDFPGRGWCQVKSADDPDSLRGEGLNRVVIDECAFVAERAFTEAIRPTLADRHGDALLISTPHGQNWFWRLWTNSSGDGTIASFRFPSSTNPFLDRDEIEAARLQLPERVFRQEFLAEFIEDAGGVFRNVNDAVDRGRRSNEPEQGKSYTLGVDLARVEDFTVLSVMDQTGKQAYFERFNQISWERQVATIASVSERYKAVVYLDSTGVGDPIFEQLRKINRMRIMPYQFTNASKERLIDHLAMKIEQGKIRLMDIPEQINELLAYQYELTPSRNVRMNAPEGMHDDTVIALALSCWGALGMGHWSAGMI